jgi:hypothetical protein
MLLSNKSLYSWAKAGKLGLAKAKARELAPKIIRVNAVARPGMFATNRRTDKMNQEMLDPIVAGIPLGRIAAPIEFANIFLSLGFGPLLFCYRGDHGHQRRNVHPGLTLGLPPRPDRKPTSMRSIANSTTVATSETLIDGAVRKAKNRLIPMIIIMYLIAYIDRANLGFAALRMNADLNLTPDLFGFAAGIFYVGYVIFEVPSNILLGRFGCMSGSLESWRPGDYYPWPLA